MYGRMLQGKPTNIQFYYVIMQLGRKTGVRLIQTLMDAMETT